MSNLSITNYLIYDKILMNLIYIYYVLVVQRIVQGSPKA